MLSSRIQKMLVNSFYCLCFIIFKRKPMKY
uniref:Uncharacterized protein n=1 Tax=Arundo donax TaxID=35708 RepID=A0A0A9FGI5_ARUDO